MIVMKFGGSSLASADSIRRVVSIIRSQTGDRPIIVTSAMGDTTDRLLEVLTEARRGDTYSALKIQDVIREQHLSACDELLRGMQRESLTGYLRVAFRDLHVRMLELAEGECTFGAELQDWVTSLGEQLSSRLLAAVLENDLGDAAHFDSRELILTSDQFTNAQPLYWETFARIRWCLPLVARNKVVVLGGFIGSTADGRTTTLGRGGSDLTASIVGAAVNAQEIQFWKDVDGMLTCDPRCLRGGHLVRRLTYGEAGELAKAGATILHPETMVPAKRLRIPIVIRSTFNPSGEGTRIEVDRQNVTGPVGKNLLKSIAVRRGVTLLELHANAKADGLLAVTKFCRQQSGERDVLYSSEQDLFIALDERTDLRAATFVSDGCLEVKVRRRQAILTVVGQISDRVGLVRSLTGMLSGFSTLILPSEEAACSLKIAVPEGSLHKCLELVHSALIADLDPRFFATHEECAPQRSRLADATLLTLNAGKPKAFVFASGFFQPN